MTNAKRILRDFRLPVADLLFRAQAMQAHYMTDQHAFAAVDASFTVQFGLDFKAKIQAALAATTPESGTDQLKIETGGLRRAMKQATEEVKYLHFFVQKAYAGDRAQQQAFGMYEMAKAGRTQAGLMFLLQKAIGLAELHEAQLLAVGYTAERMAALQASLETLEAEKQAQLNQKGQRLIITSDWYSLLNEIWAYMKLLASAREFAFPHDQAKRELYYLYPPGMFKKKKKADGANEEEID